MSNNAQSVEFYYKEKHSWFAMFAARPTVRSPIGREPYIYKRIILKSQTKGPITGINRDGQGIITERTHYYCLVDCMTIMSWTLV